MTVIERYMVFALCACSGFVLYAYAIYPVLIWWLSRRFGRLPEAPAAKPDSLPKLTLLIAAYNEEAVIEERVMNALEMDYPQDRLEIVIGLDGCSDRTAAILRAFEDRGVRTIEYAERRGKARVLNESMAAIDSDIVMLSDANTEIDSQAARRLVRWFREPQVGAVVGRLVLTDPSTGRNADGIYWKYENFLKQREGRLDGLLGANGAIYAIRRELYVPIPPETIVDDFVIPLLAKLRYGCSIVYDREAVAREETAADVASEFQRRARIGAGGFQSVALLWRLLDPRRGWIAFTFFSHKVLRWTCPFFMIGVFVLNALLWQQSFFRWTLAAQILFYSLSLVPMLAPKGLSMPNAVRMMTMFTSMNAALFVGFIRWATKRQKAAWRRTSRIAESAGALQ